MLLLRSGSQHREINFPEQAEIEILKTDSLPVLTNLTPAVEDMFNSPIRADGAQKLFLSEAVPNRVAIAVTETVIDENIKIILPSILAHLYQKNKVLKPSAITIVVDEAIKRSTELNRFKKFFQKMVASGCRVIVHDPILQKMINLGTTHRGTPVWVNSEFTNADLKIVIDRVKPSPLFGLIESPLRMASCCMSIDAIESLKKMILPRVGEDNGPGHPVLDELEEIHHMIGIENGLICLCNPMGEPIRIMAGHPVSLIRQAEAIYQRYYHITAPTSFNIAVISYGDHPPEQFPNPVQQGLLIASSVLKKGGHVLIMGNNTQKDKQDISFDYVCYSLSPAALIKEFIKSGLHSRSNGIRRWNRLTYAPNESLKKIFGSEVIRKCQFRAADPSTLLAEWVDEFEGRPRIAVIPEGSEIFCRPVL